MKPFLSVIIPCYNEEKNLKRGVLDEVEAYLGKQKFTSEVIISDEQINAITQKVEIIRNQIVEINS